MTLDQRYQEILNYLYYEIGHFNVKLGLENITELLRRWGNPQNRFWSVHVAGTNGKGSVCATTQALLTAAGYRVGMLTSPHLVDFRERIRIGNQLISKADVVRWIERLRPDVDDIGATFFETLTALAYLYFAENKVDYAVIEVGLGGRLDATRLINPAVTVITNIALDHQRLLGDTVEKIAYEKAGIIKPSIPVITAATQPEVLEVICGVAAEVEAPVIPVQRAATWDNISLMPTGTQFDYHRNNHHLEHLQFALLGEHQVINAVTALLAVEHLPKLNLTETTIRKGLQETQWHGRLHRIQRDPWIVTDGAHNPAGMMTLITSLPHIFTYERLIWVFGVLKGKRYEEMMAQMEPIAAEIICTQAESERAVDWQLLTEDVSQLVALPVVGASRVAEAIQIALAKATPQDLICIAGSLYMVGETLAYFNQTPEQLLSNSNILTP
ncbi:MAG: bifunctional folylpolyglutamate synthase/dihydrofolate synthase [Gemmatimonadetes bacterium]|nr:MAG: bifunctional folylpolyglutamate synthase/dihydrofolate synthase [Gemmatimonadota bacterium]